MKLHKLFLISSIAVAAFSFQAFSSQDATVNFNARLVAQTCDVSTSKNLISLGTHKNQGLSTTDAIAKENFNLVLNNCTKSYTNPDDQTKSVAILASGEVLTGHADMFADAQSSQVGVKLQVEPAKGTFVDIKPNNATEVTGLKVVGQNDIIVPMIAGLYATTSTASAQQLNVPVTFSIAYD